ncbi:hypothetical protein GHT06_002503 [Daphnia sinensis]|uniref:Uncharacterized protein n=1 Tax=Daphnia sinensis TaxID=1820382 RepID=A0AAD5KWL1_9CRUS|nr:hypothetical protein GHT06_002503 [Daphnia sinensis]
MYQRVRNQHARSASDNKLILLRQLTENRFKTGHNVTMHVTALEVLWLRLLDIGEQIPESQVISKILSTLPASFGHFYTKWNNSPDRGKTVKLLLSKLQEEEAIAELDQNSNKVTALDGAFASNSYGTYQNSERAFNSNRYDRPAPYHVPLGAQQGRRGGYQGGRGYIRGFRGSFRGSRGGGHQNNNLFENCRHRISDGTPIPTNGSANLSQIQQNFRQEQGDDHTDYTYASSIYGVDFETYGFVADSGASQHMTDKRSILINYKPYEEGAHTVVGIGNIRLAVK